ncbi:MAG: hypothetical protein J5493_07205 [Lachnospiraceae bacterium]|nr:hypothetical protein [Lachnospiraceae bacterium]
MKNKRTIFIELTSLLDVILIMIFVLLMQARTQTAQAMDKAAEEEKAAQEINRELDQARAEYSALEEDARTREEGLQEEIAGLNQEIGQQQEEIDGLKRRMSSRELVLDNSLLLTLSVTEDRRIRLETADREEALIPYDWANETYAVNRLRSLLSEGLCAASGRAVFLVFQYDREQIYKAEYDMILRLVNEMKLEAKQQEIPLSFLELDIQESN